MRLLFIITILSSFVGFSQAELLNTNNSANISKNSVSPDNQVTKPLDYPTVNDNDIIFSFTVWEVIDLNQKINHPFYYPINNNIDSIKKTVKGERLSLYNALNNGIQENKINFEEKDLKLLSKLKK